MNQEISLVIGTAGHIDHGKTQLVKALTGVDCDRLAEERKRGITIELGFAPLVLPSKRVISLIDVPGHERFIRQMVAGASGLDAVMLVVAADEGVMPQTREHLDILGLLGVQSGIVVLTKSDLVDPEMVAMALEDVENLVKGTFLEGSPIVAVSSVTGAGIGALTEQLESLVDLLKPRERQGAFFMPIDRTFPVAGFGTVVTGTAYRGVISQGDEVDIWPAGLESRIRSVQVHGQPVDQGTAGQRVALCLTDVRLDQLQRGDVVCAKDVYRPSSCIDVSLRLLKNAPEALTHWQRVRLHLGTSDVLARIVLLEGKTLEPGHTEPLQLVLEEPVVAALGQRFVIRFYSPLQTIGGGEVLTPYAKRPSGRKMRDAIHQKLLSLQGVENRQERILRVLDMDGQMSLPDLMVRVQERRSDLIPILEALESQKQLVHLKAGEGLLLSAQAAEGWAERFCDALKKYHQDFPHQKGMVSDDLIKALFLEEERRYGRIFLERLIAGGRIKSEEALLRMPDFVPVDDKAFCQDRDRLLEICREKGYQMPLLEELPAAMGKSAKDFASLLEQVRKSGDAAILDGTFLLSKEVEGQLMELLSSVEGGFTLAQVRDLTGSSRKYVLPLMEYLDGKGITRRVGDKRIVLRKG